MTNERIKILLQNTLSVLESHYEISIFDCDLADEIGITEEEYDELFDGEDTPERR